MKPSLIAVLVLLFAPALVKADTITHSSNRSFNGKVFYSEATGYFEVTARFSGVESFFRLRREDVLSIEFNDSRDNGGSPSPWIKRYEVESEGSYAAGSDVTGSPRTGGVSPGGTLLPPSGMTRGGKNSTPDELRLIGSTSKRGKLAKITATEVIFSAKPYNRNSVRKLIIGH